MGFVEKVKNVISKLRAAGKTEKEVSEIIEQAAEAATVLKKTESPEHPEKIKAQEFIYATGREADAELQKIAEQEYQAYLDRTVG